MGNKVITVTCNINYSDRVLDDKIFELENLVEAVESEVVLNFVQNRDSIDKAYYIGKGKAIEVKEACEKLDADTVIFNNELTGSQVKNLEEIMEVRVIDRTNLILDIFNKRAQTKEAKLQVKLAKLKYTLPRLSALRSGFSRQAGGIGTKGVGEQQIELDRRTIKRDIDAISRQLKEIEKNRFEIRKRRVNSTNPLISLVGYTNAGKSTLLNKLISYNKDENEHIKEVFVKDMLFATLDTFVREGKLNNGNSVMYVDTVGFVSDIPHNLVESFKSTLEEIKYSSLILHVIDISNPNVDEQIEVTRKMIKELDSESTPMLYVFNKKDKLEDENRILEYSEIENKIFISALDNEDINKLLNKINEMLYGKNIKCTLLIPYENQKILNSILNEYNPNSIEHLENGTKIELSLKEMHYEKYKGYII